MTKSFSHPLTTDERTQLLAEADDPKWLESEHLQCGQAVLLDLAGPKGDNPSCFVAQMEWLNCEELRKMCGLTSIYERFGARLNAALPMAEELHNIEIERLEKERAERKRTKRNKLPVKIHQSTDISKQLEGAGLFEDFCANSKVTTPASSNYERLLEQERLITQKSSLGELISHYAAWQALQLGISEEKAIHRFRDGIAGIFLSVESGADRDGVKLASAVKEYMRDSLENKQASVIDTDAPAINDRAYLQAARMLREAQATAFEKPMLLARTEIPDTLLHGASAFSIMAGAEGYRVQRASGDRGFTSLEDAISEPRKATSRRRGH